MTTLAIIFAILIVLFTNLIAEAICPSKSIKSILSALLKIGVYISTLEIFAITIILVAQYSSYVNILAFYIIYNLILLMPIGMVSSLSQNKSPIPVGVMSAVVLMASNILLIHFDGVFQPILGNCLFVTLFGSYFLLSRLVSEKRKRSCNIGCIVCSLIVGVLIYEDMVANPYNCMPFYNYISCLIGTISLYLLQLISLPGHIVGRTLKRSVFM